MQEKKSQTPDSIKPPDSSTAIKFVRANLQNDDQSTPVLMANPEPAVSKSKPKRSSKPAKKRAESNLPYDLPPVSVSTKLRFELRKKLKSACHAREQLRIQPFTMQDILNEALDEWLKNTRATLNEKRVLKLQVHPYSKSIEAIAAILAANEDLPMTGRSEPQLATCDKLYLCEFFTAEPDRKLLKFLIKKPRDCERVSRQAKTFGSRLSADNLGVT